MAEGNMTENQKLMADPHFKECCTNAGVEPTRRQASKWNLRKGKAYNIKNNIFMNGVTRV